MDWGLSLADCMTCLSRCLCSWWCDYDFVVITEKTVFWQGRETVRLIGLHAITVWRTSEIMTWEGNCPDVMENELTSALNKSNRLVDIPDVCRRPIILVTKYRVLAFVQYVRCCYNRFFLCISYNSLQEGSHGHLYCIRCLCKSRGIEHSEQRGRSCS